jgi:hypothetical protein
LHGEVDVVTDESKDPEYNEENDKWEDFAIIFMNQGAQRGGNVEKYLKAELGGGGAFGTERPQAMIEIESFQTLQC